MMLGLHYNHVGNVLVCQHSIYDFAAADIHNQQCLAAFNSYRYLTILQPGNAVGTPVFGQVNRL